jgi:hypothetical protein
MIRAHRDDRESDVPMALIQALGGVSPQLRAVAASTNETGMHVDCYYDGDVGEGERRSMSRVETELRARFPAMRAITQQLHRLDWPGSSAAVARGVGPRPG